jgi:radical SAM protein with 4Fe4S-binding SPASM domain
MTEDTAKETQFKEYLRERIDTQPTYEGLLDFPSYIEIETVNNCNARCPMCTIDEWERGNRPMTDELYAKIAKEVVANAGKVQRVSLYRDGEPLLDKKLGKRTAMLKDGGVKNVCISTNVQLLDEKRSRELLEGGMDTVIMSIDSLDKKVYEAIRVRCVFEDVMANAQRFVELRNKIRPQTQVWMRMIRQKSNENEWPAYEEFWKKRLAKTDRIYYHNIFNWGGQLKGFQPISMSYEPNLPCVALWSLMVIFCDGHVPMCNVDFNNKFPVGDVTKDSLADVWRSKQMQEYRRMHMAGRKGEISICKECNVWDEPPGDKSISARYAELVPIGGSPKP